MDRGSEIEESKGKGGARDDERGIIVFGGGNGCAGRGCLFWVLISIALSVILTVLANLLVVLL